MALIVPSRRGFIGGLLGLVAAPPIVRVGSLMKISMPKPEPKTGKGPVVGHMYVNVNADSIAVYIWDGVAWIASSNGHRVNLPVTDMKRAEITDFAPREALKLNIAGQLIEYNSPMVYMGQGFDFPDTRLPNIVRAT